MPATVSLERRLHKLDVVAGFIRLGRHVEEDRRLAREFEERQVKAKMANSRLKQIVPVEEKASSIKL